MPLCQLAEGNSRGLHARPSSPALFLEEGEGKMKVVFQKCRETWMDREDRWGNREGQRSNPLSRAATSPGSPFLSPRITLVGKWSRWEAWCAHGHSRTVVYVAKTVSFSTAFRQVRTHRCPFSQPHPHRPKRGQTEKASHAGVMPHPGVKAEVEWTRDSTEHTGEDSQGDGCRGVAMNCIGGRKTSAREIQET